MLEIRVPTRWGGESSVPGTHHPTWSQAWRMMVVRGAPAAEPTLNLNCFESQLINPQPRRGARRGRRGVGTKPLSRGVSECVSACGPGDRAWPVPRAGSCIWKVSGFMPGAGRAAERPPAHRSCANSARGRWAPVRSPQDTGPFVSLHSSRARHGGQQLQGSICLSCVCPREGRCAAGQRGPPPGPHQPGGPHTGA